MADIAQLRVLLVAEESAGVQVLRAVHDSKFQIGAVMASPPRNDKPAGPVWAAAAKLGLELWPANLVKDAVTAKRVRDIRADILLNVHSLHVIHGDVLEAPRIGAFNLHPGPLPRYAGLNAVSWAIYHGEREHGVTVHRMDPGIDTGAIVEQAMFPIEPEDTGLSLAGKCIRSGIPLMLKLLEVAASDPKNIPFTPQNLQEREYFGREVPNGGFVNWSARAEQIASFVRACDYGLFPSPWGYPRTYAGQAQTAILKASRTGKPCDQPPGTVGAVDENGALISTADDWLLVTKLKVDGRACRPAHVLKTMQRLQGSP